MKSRVDKNTWQREHRKKNNNQHTKVYEKTKSGFLMRTYRNMLSRVSGIQKKKAHLYKDKDILSKEEFYVFSYNDELFNLLFDSWTKAEYPRKYTPSIDRIDTSIGYTKENIQWITHSENSRKGAKSKWEKQLLLSPIVK